MRAQYFKQNKIDSMDAVLNSKVIHNFELPSFPITGMNIERKYASTFIKCFLIELH